MCNLRGKRPKTCFLDDTNIGFFVPDDVIKSNTRLTRVELEAPHTTRTTGRSPFPNLEPRTRS